MNAKQGENNKIEQDEATQCGCGCADEACENCSCESNGADQPCAELPETDKLAIEIEALSAKIAEQNDAHLRLMAEYDNYRRRTLKEKADLLKYGAETALTRLLTVVDDFERALTAMEKAEEVKAVRDGVELIYSKFNDYLKQNSVTVIETSEQPFDTEYHEAITTIPAPTEALKGRIIDCVQKGYLLNDKVIRFAKVVVGE